MLGVGLLQEIDDEIGEASELRGANEKELKAHMAKYKWREVVLAVRRQEETWFRQQLAGLNDDGLVPYRELVPLRQPWSFSLRWARWGRVMWKFFRWWCVARITMKIPVQDLWSVSLASTLSTCWLCGAVNVDLHHVLEECRGTAGPRSEAGVDEGGASTWALKGDGSIE